MTQAAAGGTGTMLCQLCAHLGAIVIGTTSTLDKIKIAKENGCSHVINYRLENVIQRIQEITGGKGVDVVFDGVGKDTWQISLESLKTPCGWMISFGNASGKVNLGVMEKLRERSDELPLPFPPLAFSFSYFDSNHFIAEGSCFGIVHSFKRKLPGHETHSIWIHFEQGRF